MTTYSDLVNILSKIKQIFDNEEVCNLLAFPDRIDRHPLTVHIRVKYHFPADPLEHLPHFPPSHTSPPHIYPDPSRHREVCPGTEVGRDTSGTRHHLYGSPFAALNTIPERAHTLAYV